MKTKEDSLPKFQRIKFDGIANIKFARAKYDLCQVKNLSLTGMSIQGNLAKHQKEDCIIQLFHKEQSGNNSLKAFAKIIRTGKEGADLQFTSMTFENYMLLQTTLINTAPRPEAILRELPKDFPFEISSM